MRKSTKQEMDARDCVCLRYVFANYCYDVWNRLYLLLVPEEEFGTGRAMEEIQIRLKEGFKQQHKQVEEPQIEMKEMKQSEPAEKKPKTEETKEEKPVEKKVRLLILASKTLPEPSNRRGTL